MAKKKSTRKASDHRIIDMEEARQERQKNKLAKKPTKPVKNKKPRIIVMIMILVIIAIGCGVTFRLFSLHHDREQAQARLESLENQKTSLEEELEKINDPKYIEQKAREELQMIMPNETLYVVEEKEEKI